MKFPDWAIKALKILKSNNFEAYFIGGCVRDFLLRRPFHDIDIATNALPTEIESSFSSFPVIKTGIQHGTVTVVFDGNPLEITTFRQDGRYTDNRHPDHVFFSKSLKEDASRRDLTVNAMACDEDGNIFDFFGGKKDLEQKLLRCVGDPYVRFTEDALRILRVLRFSSVLSFQIEEKTAKALFDKKSFLNGISAERIYSELCRLLCGKDAGAVLIDYLDVLGIVLPELLPLKGFDQKNPHHIYDLLTHTAKAVDSIEPVLPLRLAALFHDIGKPSCFSLDEKGIGHFYGHASVSSQMAENILLRLRVDHETIRRVVCLIRYHDAPIEESTSFIKRRLNKLGETDFFNLLKLKRADTPALHPKHRDRLEHFDRLESIAKEILSEGTCFQLKDLAVDGHDMLALGLKGKEVGNTLQELLNNVLDEKVINDRKSLLDFCRKYLQSP